MKYLLPLCACALLFSSPTIADNALNLPEGFGHPPNHTEYFDGDCCNENDCEMIPDSALQETKEGWHVRFWSTKYGGIVVEGFVPRGQERLSKKCMDGACNGVCSRLQTKQSEGSGTFGTSTPDYSKPATVHCLYIMPSA